MDEQLAPHAFGYPIPGQTNAIPYTLEGITLFGFVALFAVEARASAYERDWVHILAVKLGMPHLTVGLRVAQNVSRRQPCLDGRAALDAEVSAPTTRSARLV